MNVILDLLSDSFTTRIKQLKEYYIRINSIKLKLKNICS